MNHDLNTRREQLHLYLQDLVNRQDMRTDTYFRSFLELDTQIPESVTYQPVKVAEMNDLNLGGRDFYYDRELHLMFVAMSDMNITSRIDAYLTNFSLPWEKKTANDNYVSVGALSTYKVIVDKDDNWEFLRMWTVSFPSQTNVLEWCREQETLFVGLDSGKVHIYKVPSKVNYMTYDEQEGIKVHGKRVMGLYYNSSINMLYSIGEDGRFKITDINLKSTVYEVSPGKSGLKYMVYEQQRGIFILADADGFIYLYNALTNPPELLASIQSQSRSCIRGLTLSDGGYYLFAGASDGSMSVFEMGKPGKERFIKQLAHY
eukprot:CAMPEP_0202961928 /NCGR_PEP_ID=MMETSP1396-20130829/6027_1 /ASSEMBLY_ACC=CAM_ASM_000872 /TAXON_ID= /ORGANISM="Pseudokeronopsis sp., Strain Brazil" /LENGTH=316 /DNA_ID=CAMNT_0049682157 /DNA_START=155 /DNA_END=1105 /DNA_ORIENTATION=-